jgi:hypothetical protein
MSTSPCANSLPSPLASPLHTGWPRVDVAEGGHSELEQALERYCAEHPNAADSVEGVRTWWLADPTIPREAVEEALDALVDRGLLAVRALSDGTIVYFSQPPSPRSRGS